MGRYTYKKATLDKAYELKKRGISEKEAAKILNVSEPTVRGWYKKYNPNAPDNFFPEEDGKRCKSCKYRGEEYKKNGCDYILITGKMRGCPVIGCTRYERGERQRAKY